MPLGSPEKPKVSSRELEELIDEAAYEYHQLITERRKSNPGMKLMEVIGSEGFLLLSSDALLRESKTLKRLTIALVGFTIALVGLTAVLAGLTIFLATRR